MVAEQRAAKTLEEATETAKQQGLDVAQIVTHVLPAAGGASGVAESIVVWANKHLPDVLVLGARGMGWKRPLMSLIGLGSVSDYCVHNAHLPVVVYHPTLSADQALNGSQLTQVGKCFRCNNGSTHLCLSSAAHFFLHNVYKCAQHVQHVYTHALYYIPRWSRR